MNWLRQEWEYFYGTFHDSETILWARLNMFLGSAWAALQAADLSPVFSNPKLLTYWIIFSNFVNELARRNRAEYDDRGNIR